MFSAWNPSSDSPSPDTFADTKSTPLPWDTESERLFGRHTMTTGIPMVSSPVTTPTRVMPTWLVKRESLVSDSRGTTDRCAPSKCAFGTNVAVPSAAFTRDAFGVVSAMRSTRGSSPDQDLAPIGQAGGPGDCTW